ncbi:uncharacterized protein At1g76070 [Magnolia sinica]|uniref:uncharacterized protein At1g76070 n=1 Tax=Magnolia sinica TaxID=86752 RepID=UPI002659A566|nr:uncharacterized protein At1g76070 [Magnolia sinica]
MEKASRSKSSIFAFLPKTAQFSFSNPPFSPSSDKRTENLSKLKTHQGRGFSGPIISIIPAEARRKTKNGSFDEQEPTSPKVSCIGQIKHKKKMCKAKCSMPSPKPERKPDKKASFKISRILRGSGGATKPGRKSDADAHVVAQSALAPSLGQMKRFASGRDTLSDFDWKSYGGPPADRHREYYSDDDRAGSDDDDDGFIVPHSAPLVMGGPVTFVGPRKEVNLWKRRTMAPPRPLEFKRK